MADHDTLNAERQDVARPVLACTIPRVPACSTDVLAIAGASGLVECPKHDVCDPRGIIWPVGIGPSLRVEDLTVVEAVGRPSGGVGDGVSH